MPSQAIVSLRVASFESWRVFFYAPQFILSWKGSPHFVFFWFLEGAICTFYYFKSGWAAWWWLNENDLITAFILKSAQMSHLTKSCSILEIDSSLYVK